MTYTQITILSAGQPPPGFATENHWDHAGRSHFKSTLSVTDPLILESQLFILLSKLIRQVTGNKKNKKEQQYKSFVVKFLNK